MNYEMKNKTVLLVGGGGTGKHASTLFGTEGVKVVVADIDEDAGEKSVEMAKQAGGEAAFVKCDVLDEKSVAEAVKFTVDKYGQLNFAVNIVGMNNKFTGIVDLTKEEYEYAMNINLRSTFFCMKYEIPAMVKVGGGSIVNVGSTASLMGVLAHGAYTAAEHALVGLTKSAAIDYAKQDIRVNIVCPGVMLSSALQQRLNADPQFGDILLKDIPLGRFSGQEEVAALYVYLCSNYAASITGAAISVDGGRAA